jgi:hypothetical protein
VSCNSYLHAGSFISPRGPHKSILMPGHKSVPLNARDHKSLHVQKRRDRLSLRSLAAPWGFSEQG